MRIQDLPEDEQKRVIWVLKWIDRMTKKYGASVCDKNGKIWDWGQALCRECYGSNWMNVLEEENITTPSWDDIEKAKIWENGKMPKWVKNER